MEACFHRRASPSAHPFPIVMSCRAEGVRLPSDRSASCPELGLVAQLGERLLCKQEVIGSIPFTSTTVAALGRNDERQRRLWRRESERRVSRLLP